MYTSLALTPTATNAGVYKSINGGATWARVSNATMNALFTTNTSNAELATGRFGEVYASIINAGVVVGLFRSPDSGATWTAMDIPKTNENGTDVGLNRAVRKARSRELRMKSPADKGAFTFRWLPIQITPTSCTSEVIANLVPTAIPDPFQFDRRKQLYRAAVPRRCFSAFGKPVRTLNAQQYTRRIRRLERDPTAHLTPILAT